MMLIEFGGSRLAPRCSLPNRVSAGDSPFLDSNIFQQRHPMILNTRTLNQHEAAENSLAFLVPDCVPGELS